MGKAPAAKHISQVGRPVHAADTTSYSAVVPTKAKTVRLRARCSRRGARLQPPVRWTFVRATEAALSRGMRQSSVSANVGAGGRR
jgi:hypothetical protein